MELGVYNIYDTDVVLLLEIYTTVEAGEGDLVLLIPHAPSQAQRLK